MKRVSPGLAAAFVFMAGAMGQDAVLLPAYTPARNTSSPQFRFAAASDQPPQREGWRVPGLPRRYFDEVLPALFERTLIIERLDANRGRLEWIYTGEFGGFTVAVDSHEMTVSQRYYDSFGYGTPQPPARHPEKIVTHTTVTYRGDLHAVAVRLDSRLGLAVSLNGKEVLRQNCLMDVNRHQLAWTGSEGEAGGYLLTPETAEASVEVDAARRHQTMLGFGGITTPTAYAQLSAEGKRRWWKILAEYNLLLHREYPIGARLDRSMDNWDRMADAMPHYYGDNFPNGEVSDFSYIRNIRRLGGKVLFEFWELPPWTRRDSADADGKVYPGAAEPEAYAQAMVRYCQVSRERTGAPPDIVGIQNEVRQPAGIWHEMALRLRAELNRAGFSRVAIHMRDDGMLAGGIECARAFLQSDSAWKAIDYSASHMYDYQKFFYDPDGFDKILAQWHELTGGKPFLSTELSINSIDFQTRSYRLALAMGQLYHKNLTLADASAIFYCWLLLNVEQPSYGWTRTLFVPDPAHGFVPAASSYQARVFGAFSRRIRAGMARVEARASEPGVLPAAFTGAGGARTLVVMNRSLRPQRIQVNWSGKPFRFLEWTSASEENRVAPAPSAASLVVPPGTIVTLSTEELGSIRFQPEGIGGNSSATR